MLLAPELEQRTGQPAAIGSQMMNARVASGANGQQQFGLVPAGTPVMDMERLPRPASPTASPVPFEHLFPVAPEPPPGIPLALAAAPALSSPPRQRLATAAEQASLLEPQVSPGSNKAAGWSGGGHDSTLERITNNRYRQYGLSVAIKNFYGPVVKRSLRNVAEELYPARRSYFMRIQRLPFPAGGRAR
jgi:hypothetical protein